MIVPDTNLLLYAYDSTSPFHQRAASWWEACLSGSETVGLCEVVLYAFIRLSTNRRVFERPMSIDEAAACVESWLERRTTDLLVARDGDLLRALAWLRSAGAGGNLTTDAQIAAIASRHRGTIHTADTDFDRFPGVSWRNPLIAG